MSNASSPSPLHTLLDQLSTELHACLRRIIPDIKEETLDQLKKNEYPDVYNKEADTIKAKLIENQTHKFLSVAKQMEIELTKIIYSERQTEEVILTEEIHGLQQTILQQKEVITKYTSLMRQWTKEFEELEYENKDPL
ncbi:11140_t:CDS:2 [Funneliformis caledonium]|uniref:11140_t:CDS:1 n=1 Tax=Funneliformis caledonium TaxID=1117310 RepID=A0A9N8VGD5_9GLOM|nr:11140_t:CDS:2 [Funneliformis caledonium]